MEKTPNRQSANLIVDHAPVSEAHDTRIDRSHVAKDGIASAIKKGREHLWRLDNARAIAEMNNYTDNHGLPLARYRQF